MGSVQRNADFLTPPPFIPRTAERLMILVTDDDGIPSEGIIVLAKALQEMGDVFVVDERIRHDRH
jgi:hypothetical protein